MTVSVTIGWYVVLLVLGTVALYVGAELLVAGAGRLAMGVGLRAATVGVTVIAFATTAPELFVSVIGVAQLSTDVGLGTVIGSNVANIGLVLGVAALIRPLEVSETVMKRHVPFMVLATVVLLVLGADGELDRLDGIIMLGTLVAFTLYLLYYVRTDPLPGTEDDGVTDIDRRDLAYVLGGLVALAVGSHWLIGGGSGLLAEMGVSDLVIGLTVLAIGTSLPELAASVIGAVRDNAGFSVGNVVGSNVYNILAVLGLVALFVPITVPAETFGAELPALLVITIAVVAMMAFNRKLTRIDGAILVGVYLVFFWFLFQ